jgi:valyl-tRNA synthetase
MTFHPDRYAKSYEQWHDNIRDWCISRQLWWGHRIPVWHSVPGTRGHKLAEVGSSHPDIRELVEALRPAEESGRLFSRQQPTILKDGTGVSTTRLEFLFGAGPTDKPFFLCVNDPEGADKSLVELLEANGFVRDPDVLDTWFSSALWPISTMGWPDAKSAGPEFAGLLHAFNPTSLLCTAREIITLWVSRMVMFNRYLLPAEGSQGESGHGRGPIPFHDVFIHPVIQDGEGRKMSKSLGNGVDPLDIIATHGADAMRFTLCQMCTETQDIRMPVQKDSTTGKNTSPKFDLGRNFCNKLWNATRFALGILNAPGTTPATGTVAPSAALSLPDRWMLSRLAAGTAEVNAALNTYEFSKYAQTLYDLLWRDFCDWYLEAIKPTVANDAAQRTVLIHALETIVRLLHPIAPFVTESLFEHLKQVPRAKFAGIEFGEPRKAGLLCTAGWPTVAASLRDEAAEKTFEHMRSIITAIREVRAQQQIKPSRRITLHVPATLNLAEIQGLLTTLGGLEAITSAAPNGPSATFTLDGAEYKLSNLADAVDEGAEKARIQKQIADLEKSVTTLEARLANPGYADRAPPAMVQQSRDQLAKVQADLAAAKASLAKLG